MPSLRAVQLRVAPLPLILFLALLLGACAASEPAALRGPERVAALPDVPRVEGPLQVELTYPRPGAYKPSADSTFIFGTVGTGAAKLQINGLRVPVAANGAFLAYLPVPKDGVYRMVAEAGGRREMATYAYATPPPPRLSVEAFATPRLAVVTSGKDTLATGSEIAHAAPRPGGDRLWFFPIGTRLVVTGRAQGHLRVALTPDTEAWIDEAAVALGEATSDVPGDLGAVTMAAAGDYVDVRIDADQAPFRIVPRGEELRVTFYGRRAPAEEPSVAAGGFVRSAAWKTSSPDSALLALTLDEPAWGYMAFYNADSALVVRVRRPPTITAEAPLQGLRVMVDAGHPPGGAIGPTGYTEAEANLAVSMRLAEMLRARGAEVLMTRTSPEPLVSSESAATELWARVDLAVAQGVDLLVSVHNNAFGDGVNPFDNYGTEVYYYHPFSAAFAQAMVGELAAVTGLPNLGAKQRSLALVRPSWMPSVLTESLFMMFPQQEAALKDEGFVERLAAAHLRGIEAFLQSR